MFNLLNGIPVIGHAKGLLHYASGNSYEGDKVMHAANRTTAVMAGGAVGVVGGPAGVVAGAAGAGLLVDSIASVVTNKPQGILDGISDIATDIGNGDVPVRSVLKTGIYVGADALSGFGGGSIATGMSGAMGKSIVKDVAVVVAKNGPACQLVAAGSLSREVAKNAPSSQPKPRKSGSSGRSSSPPPSQPSASPSNNSKPTNTSASGSGSQPPNERNPDKKDHEKDQSESHLSIFLRIFGVSSLEDVIIRGVCLFKNLKSGQRKALKKLINQLRLNGYLTRVIHTIKNLFNKIDKSDITFQNFLSLTQFVAAYIGEQVALKNEAQKGTQSEDSVRPFKERREENCKAVSRRSILDIFTSLLLEIVQHKCEPQFRNIFSAIYHYFKHRVIPEDGGILTLSEYFNIIKRMLRRIKLLDEYSELIDEAHPRRELVYDRVLRPFRRRIRIVLKIQDGKLELSSCYFLDYTFDDDDDSDEFIQ